MMMIMKMIKNKQTSGILLTFNKDDYQMSSQVKALTKEQRIFKNVKRTTDRICKDCGRYGKIPKQFCFDCYKETIKTLRNPN